MYFFFIIFQDLLSRVFPAASIMQSLLFIECKNLILMKIVPSQRSSAACEFLCIECERELKDLDMKYFERLVSSFTSQSTPGKYSLMCKNFIALFIEH